MFSVGFGTLSCIFLHFLQTYRCVPTIGFPADMFICTFFDFPLKYRCVPEIVFSADILSDIFCWQFCITLLADIHVRHFSTDLEERRERKEEEEGGADLT